MAHKLVKLFTFIALSLGLSAPVASAADRRQIELIRERGQLRCGIDLNPGFAAIGSDGRPYGFDIDFCRAIAAAVLNNPDAISVSRATTPRRLQAVVEREIDIAFGGAAWTMARETTQPIAFPTVTFHDTQGFIVWRDAKIGHLTDLAGRRVCVQSGTLAFDRLASGAYPALTGAQLIESRTNEEKINLFLQRRCDATTGETAILAGQRLLFAAAGERVALLDQTIGREPVGPAIRAGDWEFFEVVRWTVALLIAAEHYGIDQNLASTGRGHLSGERQVILGANPDMPGPGGLDPAWSRRVLAAVGHYGEIFERHLGAKTELKLPRGPNRPWSQGGLLYAPPFR